MKDNSGRIYSKAILSSFPALFFSFLSKSGQTVQSGVGFFAAFEQCTLKHELKCKTKTVFKMVRFYCLVIFFQSTLTEDLCKIYLLST